MCLVGILIQINIYIKVLNEDCGVSGCCLEIMLCNNVMSAFRSALVSNMSVQRELPRVQGMLTNHKNFLTASTTSASADKTACTQQPHLRPGCCLHAVSSLDIVVARGPLTPLAMYGHVFTFILDSYTTPQTRATLGTIISRDRNPGLCHEPVNANRKRM